MNKKETHDKRTETHLCDYGKKETHGDVISRQAAIDWLSNEWDGMVTSVFDGIKNLPSAEPEDWMEQNKDRILKAGMEGREVEFRIGGRLFAIREKAQ